MTGVARCLNLIGKCSNDAVSTVIMAGTGRAFRAGVDISVSRPLIAKNRGNLIEHGDANITPTKLLPGWISQSSRPCEASLLAPVAGWRLAAILLSPRKARASAIRNRGPA
jgi:hypothetical protein